MKLLLVDDEEDIRTLLEYNLSKIKLIIESAKDSFEVLRKFERFQPDIVILDIMMAGQDGIEICKEIRAKNTSNEKYNVYGKVYDKTNAEELIGASVYLLNSSTGTITDFNGSYKLNEIPKGQQKIICQYISYQNDTLEINISEDVAFNFQLVEETITLAL